MSTDTIPDAALLNVWAQPRRVLMQTQLEGLFQDAWPPRFGEMCRYPLLTGGKRMRPLLTFAAFEALGTSEASGGAALLTSLSSALPAALAVELVHCYSLVHDDLPSMDDDDERRGKPTVHVTYGEGNAVLVGDALLTEAFRLLAEGSSPLAASVRLAMVAELSRAAGYTGMIGGQAADVGVGGPIVDVQTLTRLHRNKTGALIRCAVRMGALAGGASSDALARLTRYAESVGLAFQLADDLLDIEQDAGPDGPPSFPRLLGAAETRRRALSLATKAREAGEGLARPEILLALAEYTITREI